MRAEGLTEAHTEYQGWRWESKAGEQAPEPGSLPQPSPALESGPCLGRGEGNGA